MAARITPGLDMPIQFPGGPSIYDQIGQGVKSVEDYRAIRDLATQRGQALQQGALGLLTGQQKADEYTRGLKEQEGLRALVGDPTFNRNAPDARARVYQVAPGLADKVFQGWAAQDKSAADVTHLGAQTEQQKAAATKAASENANLVLGQFKQFIPNVQTAQDMEELTKAMYAHPIAGPIMASHAPLEKALAAIPQDPKVLQENLKKWAMGTTDYVKDQTTRQGHELTAGTSLATNAATNAAHVQTNAATVAEQRRAHNMQDERSRETVAATMTKPFEVTGADGAPMLVQQDKQGNIKPVAGYGPKTGASKPLTDSQAKALGFEIGRAHV